jgi:hypothetical protein
LQKEYNFRFFFNLEVVIAVNPVGVYGVPQPLVDANPDDNEGNERTILKYLYNDIFL